MKQRPAEFSHKRTMGGQKDSFVKRYNLNKHSHPIEWLNAFLPQTPMDNKEDPRIPDVKGDAKKKGETATKFSMSNWTSYSKTKAMLVNLRRDNDDDETAVEEEEAPIEAST